MAKNDYPRRFYPLTSPDLFRGMFPRHFEEWFEEGWRPEFRGMRADLKETDAAYILEAELPGFKKENISVEYKDNRLIVSAKKEEETKVEKENYIKRERHYGEAYRRFRVEGIKEQEISAEFKDGILTVTMPKAELAVEAQKKIEIT